MEEFYLDLILISQIADRGDNILGFRGNYRKKEDKINPLEKREKYFQVLGSSEA